MLDWIVLVWIVFVRIMEARPEQGFAATVARQRAGDDKASGNLPAQFCAGFPIRSAACPVLRGLLMR
jgi:hypothetical protein